MQDQQALLDTLYAFVYAERDANQQHLEQTWQRELPDKLLHGWTQAFTHLERTNNPVQFWAYPADNESRYREGDMLRLHLGDVRTQLLRPRVKFEREEEGRWLLSDDLAPMIWEQYEQGPCYADPDGMDLTGWYVQALDEIASIAPADNTLLPLLGPTPCITFNEADFEHAEQLAVDEGCNDKQALAVGMAFAAEQVACIQGPPGTGKTRALALIAQLLVARNERVLVTSHTHMAINNALVKIAGRGVAVVKVGGRREDLDASVDWVKEPVNWTSCPPGNQGYVMGATPFATCTVLDKYSFDTVIFDEASQITLPLALMAMRKGKRFIFIGDQKQLPPVIQSQSILDGHGMSIFARLTAQNAAHTVMLEETYRMNRWLTQWPSQAYYAGLLHAAGPNASRCLQGTPSTVVAHEALAPQACAVFIATDDTRAKNRNPRDAQRVVRLCEMAVAMGLSLHEIGIVSPYRAQGRMIRTLLAQSFGREAARQVVADTVERMQGQERELIILSLASGDERFIGKIGEFFFQPERLNVSITRAMTKLIVIGPELKNGIVCDDDKVTAWASAYRQMIASCQRVEFAP
ncbi:AAA family ATPase [Pseudomonas syringae]|nr:AAA family ATPase [Pseudomonas syringae]MBD8576451.1 AAA family ATPase [Pseudomonas syringae]MBD8791638.1 AAA family ATPase [Pseudomonas syringae]MBD8802536.1 AAA family ATPase [Pseudomonas syringae]MBD8814936.1 AAA family ATPase [Pseudomonas syringae]